MSNFGERAWVPPDPPEPDYQAELAAACQEIETLRAALEAEKLTGLAMTRAWQKNRAALERARALLAELEWCGVDNWLECPWCLGTKAEHYGEPAGHKPDCKLAALLSAASGGAA